MLKIGFIGGGNIAEAIIYGLRQNSQAEIRVVNRSNGERLKNLADKYEIIPSDLSGLVEKSDVLMIAVKPKDVVGVAKTLAEYPIAGKLVISVAAGVKLATLEKHLPNVAVIRAMPNTSSAALYSMTGLVKGKLALAKHTEAAEEIFATVGHILWIPENRMNALMAVSGSGPAYYYLFTECLIQAGVQLGLTEQESEMLARETLIGVGRMMAQSGKHPGKLREEVTSPNGTTMEALKVLWSAGLPQTMVQATRACQKRAEEMEGEYSGS